MDLFDVVTVGNATLDNFLWIHDSNNHFRLNEETRELCIKLGDKSLIDKAYFLVGGNAANVAVGLSRLGAKTAIFAEVGDDEFGQKVINTLSKDRVSEVFLKKIPGQPTSFSVIINYKGDRTIFEEKVKKHHDYSFENVSTKWIYLTSVGDNWDKAYGRVLEFIKEKGVRLAFNPGPAQLDRVDGIAEVLRNTELLFVDKGEAAKILKNSDTHVSYEEEMRRYLTGLREKGVKNAVITDGPKGAFLIDESGESFYHKPNDSSPVERTGAGDSFASGFLGAVVNGKDLKTAMEWGARNAASVIGQVGSQPGLLTKEQIETV